jgi:hypothetical protein
MKKCVNYSIFTISVTDPIPIQSRTEAMFGLRRIFAVFVQHSKNVSSIDDPLFGLQHAPITQGIHTFLERISN